VPGTYHKLEVDVKGFQWSDMAKAKFHGRTLLRRIPKFLIQVVTFFFKICGVFLLVYCRGMMFVIRKYTAATFFPQNGENYPKVTKK